MMTPGVEVVAFAVLATDTVREELGTQGVTNTAPRIEETEEVNATYDRPEGMTTCESAVAPNVAKMV